MRKRYTLAAVLAWPALVGCGHATTSFVKSDTTLGRVVVYRNGVAYFERYAEVQGDSLRLRVPEDKVNDFLKSLTVVDATTGEPTPVSYPSTGAGGTIDMKVGIGHGAGAHKLRLSYVTEAPSWKPSYRVVVNKAGKVELQGWAIVDNTSGEDWRDVKLGVGASSAMSFRFDLKNLRLVERETLQQNDLFVQAPPTGGAAYGQPRVTVASQRLMADFDDDVLAANTREEEKRSPSRPALPGKSRQLAQGQALGGGMGHGAATRSAAPPVTGGPCTWMRSASWPTRSAGIEIRSWWRATPGRATRTRWAPR